MTTPEPLSDPGVRAIVAYWQQPTGYQQAPAGMVELAQRNIDQLAATIDSLSAERDRLRALLDSHLSAQSDLDALGVMTARAQAAEERADGWESLISGSAEVTDAVAARRRQIEDWRRGAERTDAAETALARAVELLRRVRDTHHVVRPCHCEICVFLAARDTSEERS